MHVCSVRSKATNAHDACDITRKTQLIIRTSIAYKRNRTLTNNRHYLNKWNFI